MVRRHERIHGQSSQDEASNTHHRQPIFRPREDIMNQKTTGLSEHYRAALKRHLGSRSKSNLGPALAIGKKAVLLGTETLELARIHEHAVGLLFKSPPTATQLRDAERFFAEAITPIIETHRAARQYQSELDQLNTQLTRRTSELATTNRQLHQGALRRKSVELALKESSDKYSKLLKDSLQLQEGLRNLTHQVLSAQELERKKISKQLRDDIAQNLVGINVRLLAMKHEARSNTQKLKVEIASTQRMVVKSVKSVQRVARGFNSP